jgi:hypothetical protein
VNCIAINGMSNRSATTSTIMICLLFCIIINVLISLTFQLVQLYDCLLLIIFLKVSEGLFSRQILIEELSLQFRPKLC